MIQRTISFVFIVLVKLYQYLLSPIIPKACRFLPTCSDYTIEAIKLHGPFYGSFLGIKRIMHCNPFSKKSGIDNVPTKKETNYD